MPATTPESKRRQILFRAAAIALGILPFILLEAALRFAGAGRTGAANDALSGFNQNIPLFKQEGSVYRTVAAREPFFSNQEFAAIKPTNEFRIFCFGGSTVYGHPYQSETAFPKWLEVELAGSNPAKHYQAVNCGGVSYASYRLAPLVKEVLGYQADLVIVMTGENEFLEDRTYQSVKARSAMRAWIEDGFHSLRIVNLARRWIGGPPASRGAEKGHEGTDHPDAGIKTRLDENSGYASYHRDPPWQDRVAAEFEKSIRAMVGHCRAAGVPLIIVKPGSNLRDCPPFKSEHRPNLSEPEERAWQAAFEAATAEDVAAAGEAATLASPKLAKALEYYRKAEAIDGEFALLHWRVARVLDRQGKKDDALAHYLKARDLDICPLRTPQRHELILEQIAGETRTPLVDAATLLASQSPDRIPGNNWYLDHVHPTIAGHQKIAQLIAARVHNLGLVAASASWPEAQRREAYRRQFQQLASNYLADGRRRVEWLDHWARRERLLDETLPNDARGHLHWGFRQFDLGNEDGAWQSFVEAIKRDANASAMLEERARELESQGRPEAAEQLLRRLRSLDRNPPSKS